jgi:hypothetical protein
MALAILLGGFFGLLVAGGVLVVGTVRHARRAEAEMNVAFAEARGEPRSSEVGPGVWSSFDMESLREEGYDVDRSDPYATLTGELTVASEISWSESTLADGQAPRAGVATESGVFTESVVVAEPADVDEPAAIDNAAEIDEPAVFEQDAEIDQPVFFDQDAEIDEPVYIDQPAEVDEPVYKIPEPVAAGAAPVARRAAPTPVRDQPVVWRAPAQSQVIILAVALRALADGVAATVSPEAWDGFDDTVAQVRGATQRGSGHGRRPSIDVDGHDRRPSTGRANGGARRRSAPPRRPGGPARITWRAR